MKALREKIMTAGFGNLFKRWSIVVLCVVLLGGGISAALLAPQIREAVAAVQTIHQQKNQWEYNYPSNRHERKKEHRDWLAAKKVFRASVTRPSDVAVLSVGITAAFCGLLAIAFWLLAAAWLYQTAVLSGMNGALWGILGLCGSILSAALFAVVRSLLRRKCSICGNWQDKKAAYCTTCGNHMSRKCPDCGGDCSLNSRFCSNCGAHLENS